MAVSRQIAAGTASPRRRPLLPRHVDRPSPVPLLWAVWGVLAATAYGKSVRNALRLMIHPAAADVLHDSHGNAVTGAAAQALRVHLTFVGAWLEIICAAAAVALAAFTQLDRSELGLRGTARTRYVVGRGVGAGLAYVFILAAAGAVTNQLLAQVGVVARGYPGAGDAANNAALAGALLFSSAAAGVGEEILLFAVPIALARRSGWSPLAALTLVTALRWTIHAYYGWGSLFVLLWIPAGYLLYRAAGSIWPLIAAHALFDALLFSSDAWPSHTDIFTAAGLTLAVAGAAVVTISSSRYSLDRQARRRAAST